MNTDKCVKRAVRGCTIHYITRRRQRADKIALINSTGLWRRRTREDLLKWSLGWLQSNGFHKRLLRLGDRFGRTLSELWP